MLSTISGPRSLPILLCTGFRALLKGSMLLAAIFLSLFFSALSIAQSMVMPGINSPSYSLTDRNGVNLTSLRPYAQIKDVTIGSKERPFEHWTLTDDGETGIPTFRLADSYWGKVQPAFGYDSSPTCTGTSYLDVSLGTSTDRMCGAAGGSYTALRGTAATMVTNSDGTLTYTQADNTKRLYGIKVSSILWLITRITEPNGLLTVFSYKSAVVGGTTIYRLQSVRRNDGLMFKYSYASNTAPTTLGDDPWLRVRGVTAINTAIEYCDPLADFCNTAESWPFTWVDRTVSGSLTYYTIEHGGGRTRFTAGIPSLSGGTYLNPVNYTTNQMLAVAVQTPNAPCCTDQIVYTYCAVSGEYNCMHQGIKKLNTAGYEWAYPATSGSGGPSLFIQVNATRPVGGGQTVQQQRGNSSAGPLISYTDSIGKRTVYFDTSLANRVSHVTLGDGDDLSYTYDGRGNITQETHTPSSGSPLAPTIRTANFDSGCSYPTKCNKPNWIRDAKNNQTDYVYSSVHGGVLKVTSPPDSSGVRPEVRYSYTQKYAWYKSYPTGALAQSGTAIWLLTGEKYCRKSSALSGGGCSAAGDEVSIVYDYGPANAPNNLFLRGRAVTADGVTLRTCYGYDIYGNVISAASPRAGLGSCP